MKNKLVYTTTEPVSQYFWNRYGVSYKDRWNWKKYVPQIDGTGNYLWNRYNCTNNIYHLANNYNYIASARYPYWNRPETYDYYLCGTVVTEPYANTLRKTFTERWQPHDITFINSVTINGSAHQFNSMSEISRFIQEDALYYVGQSLASTSLLEYGTNFNTYNSDYRVGEVRIPMTSDYWKRHAILMENKIDLTDVEKFNLTTKNDYTWGYASSNGCKQYTLNCAYMPIIMLVNAYNQPINTSSQYRVANPTDTSGIYLTTPQSYILYDETARIYTLNNVYFLNLYGRTQQKSTLYITYQDSFPNQQTARLKYSNSPGQLFDVKALADIVYFAGYDTVNTTTTRLYGNSTTNILTTLATSQRTMSAITYGFHDNLYTAASGEDESEVIVDASAVVDSVTDTDKNKYPENGYYSTDSYWYRAAPSQRNYNWKCYSATALSTKTYTYNSFDYKALSTTNAKTVYNKCTDSNVLSYWSENDTRYAYRNAGSYASLGWGSSSSFTLTKYPFYEGMLEDGTDNSITGINYNDLTNGQEFPFVYPTSGSYIAQEAKNFIPYLKQGYSFIKYTANSVTHYYPIFPSTYVYKDSSTLCIYNTIDYYSSTSSAAYKVIDNPIGTFESVCNDEYYALIYDDEDYIIPVWAGIGGGYVKGLIINADEPTSESSETAITGGFYSSDTKYRHIISEQQDYSKTYLFDVGSYESDTFPLNDIAANTPTLFYEYKDYHVPTYGAGDYVGDVNSYEGIDTYPQNGYQDGYWYIYQNKTQGYYKGEFIGTVSALSANAYPNDGRQTGYYYIFDSSTSGYTLTLTDEYIIGGVNYTASLNSEELIFGAISSKEISFKIKDATTLVPLLQNKPCNYYIDWEDGEGYKLMGWFRNRAVQYEQNVYANITAQDGLYHILESEYQIDTSTYTTGEALKTTFLPMVVGICEATAGTYGGGYIPSTARTDSYQDVLAYSAGIGRGIYFITPDNKLTAKPYTETGVALSSSDYMEYFYEPYNEQQIHRLIAGGYSSGDGETSLYQQSTYTMTNPYYTFTSQAVDNLFTNIKTINYVPAEVRLLKDYGVQLGDIITVNDNKFLVMEKTITAAGVTLKCSGSKYRK